MNKDSKKDPQAAGMAILGVGVLVVILSCAALAWFLYTKVS